MNKRNSRVRFFSIWRLLLSGILGFILPLSYVFAFSVVSDYLGRPAPNFLVYPFGWPRPLWIFFLGHQPTDDDIAFGIVFLVVCNIVLYGTFVYLTLFAIKVLRRKPAELSSPPLPQLASDV